MSYGVSGDPEIAGNALMRTRAGAMLFTAWFEDPFRPTQDVDLLGHGDPAVAHIKATFRAICATDAVDGLVFDVDGLKAGFIREDRQYGGVERGNRSCREELYYRRDLLAEPIGDIRYELKQAVLKYNTCRPH